MPLPARQKKIVSIYLQIGEFSDLEEVLLQDQVKLGVIEGDIDTTRGGTGYIFYLLQLVT